MKNFYSDNSLYIKVAFNSAIASLIISSIFLESVLGSSYFGTKFFVFFIVIYCSYLLGRTNKNIDK